jgi:hypothetical protein
VAEFLCQFVLKCFLLTSGKDVWLLRGAIRFLNDAAHAATAPSQGVVFAQSSNDEFTGSL